LSGAGFPEFSQPGNQLDRRGEISIQLQIVRNSAPIAAFGRYVHLALHQKLAPACGRPALD